MEVETKFKPGDTVWRMKNNKPLSAKVVRVEVSLAFYMNGTSTVQRYFVCDNGSFCPVEIPVEENGNLYATADELKDALFN